MDTEDDDYDYNITYLLSLSPSLSLSLSLSLSRFQTAPHFKYMSQAIRKTWGVDPLYVREGGTIRVTPFLESVLNAPALHYPMGQSSDRAHLDNERIRLENLIRGKDVLKDFILLFGEHHHKDE